MREEEIRKLRKKILSAMKRSEFRGEAPVFGTGPVPCSLMVIGEAPGREETKLGRPFVGRAGKFFTAILEEALGKKRDEIYITNVVKVWPTLPTKRLKTRKPLRGEEEFFLPFLREEVKIVNPRVILAVGKTAFSAVSPGEEFRVGQWTKAFDNRPVMPIYHPSYILRFQKKLKENTKDLKGALRKVRRKLS